MAGFIVKILMCPIAVIIAAYLFANVDYPAIYQPIIVGLVIAVIGHMMELMLLRRGTFWISTIADFIAATLLVYFISLLFAGTYVTFLGAVLTGILLAISEYFQHLWLIGSDRTQNTPAGEH